jgi:hypothetical protein
LDQNPGGCKTSITPTPDPCVVGIDIRKRLLQISETIVHPKFFKIFYLLGHCDLIFDFNSSQLPVQLKHFILTISAAPPPIDVDIDVLAICHDVVLEA